MKILSIDIETYSATDLRKSGVYRYAEDPGFTVLLFAYSVDGGEVEVVDLTSRTLPLWIHHALMDKSITKTAFNAQFEMVCLAKYTGLPLDPLQWDCTMVRAAMAGLPLNLEMAAKVLGVEQQKMKEGKALINYFSKPCKPTKTNGGRTRNQPEQAPDKWASFIEYCAQDVRTEQDIYNKLQWVRIDERERRIWAIDQHINNRGVKLDLTLVNNAVRIYEQNKEMLTEQAVDLTGMDNPNSVSQLKSWLEEQLGSDEIDSLNKEAIKKLIASSNDPDVTEMLKIRQELGKTSVKKYVKMLDTVCSDGRVRGMTQYYGANRTGRWAGRFIQLQNLPQNHLEDLDVARDLLLSGDREAIAICYGNVPNTLSELIRTSFVASPGHTLAVADFSAIEARVIAWLADEKWRLDVFETHGKIYEASASHMFKVPIDEIVKGSPLRQKGKIAELALGYQGGVGALSAMDTRGDIPDHEKQQIIYDWRRASPSIVRLWKTCEDAALTAIAESTTITINKGIKFIGGRGMLFIELPTGRRLSYVRPRIYENKFGKPGILYEGIDQVKRVWRSDTDTYGGKLTENIVQALARDCLAEAMIRIESFGIHIVMHIHDEVVCEVPDAWAEDNLEDICRLMGEPIPWAPGLLLKADGYLTKFYKKD